MIKISSRTIITTSLVLLSLFITKLSMAEELYVQFGTALRGYDAVAYHKKNKAIEGSTRYAVHYNGLTYLFKSRRNKNTFEDNPEKYIPAYNGYCAVGVSHGDKLPTDPKAFSVVDGKLYMNYNISVQRSWLKDIKGYIKLADKHWKRIQNIHPDKL